MTLAAPHPDRRAYRRDTPENRREALIAATLSLIAEGGPEAATVRAIAARAEVTPGLIRHYFAGKEELVAAAYEQHMLAMVAESDQASVAGLSPKARLAAFVAAALRPPVTDPLNVGLWAAFMTTVRRDGRMRAIHEASYRAFRDRLEDLIGAALAAEGRAVDAARLRMLAIAANAVIDGLWIEAGAIPDRFEPDQPAQIGLAAVAALTGLTELERD